MTRPRYAPVRGPNVTPEVYVELMQLLARYSIARDDQDLDTLLDTLTPSARFERRGVVVSGHGPLRAFYEASIQRYDWTTHTTHTALFHVIDAERVGGVVTGHAELVLAGTMHQASYRYRDEYVLTDGRWLIDSRELAFHYAVPVAELGEDLSGPDRIRWAGRPRELADYPETLETWRAGGQP